MDYKEKYEQGLECIQEILGGAGDSIKTSILRKRLQPFFPELVGSEDEKMRKMCMRYLDWEYQHCYSNEDKKRIEKCIAWLEKQGEKDPCIGCTNDKGCVTCENGNLKEIKIEQTPVYNVEQKLKVGNWFVNNRKDVFLIKSIDTNGYCTLEDIKGNIISPCLPPCESDSHIWTITDAKDGDVLVCQPTFNDKKVVFIFKQLVNHASEIDCHCCIDGYDTFDPCLNDCYYLGDVSHGSYAPATKDQRNLLFQKMKDAGYEWNSETKKLIKL